MTLVSPLRWLAAAVSSLIRGGFLLWGSLAVYYSNLPWPTARLLLAVVFFAFGIWALWIAPRRRGWTIFAIAYALLLGWWWSIPPSQDRNWRPEVAVLPRAEVDGDRLRIYNYRNFDYRSRDDFTPRYETRDYELSHLTGVDFYVSYWTEGPVGHTFLSFIFDNAEPLSVSIETRPEVGEGFDPLASLFKQFELIYVVGDERDIVRVRTDYRNEDVYLYRLNISPESARALLMVYVERINELAAKPEFYHLLSNSCTINIIRYANMIGRTGRLQLAHILNGWIDTYLYNSGRIDTSLPFDELRRRSHINEAAVAAGDRPDFWQRIRVGLPTTRQRDASPTTR
jgi:Domain of unknown function (DUF4105)